MTTKSSLSAHKARYLKKLEEYCKFKPYRGGVEVLEIYKVTYVKNKNLQIVAEEFDDAWDKSGLDTCIRVASEIQHKRNEDLTVQLKTTAKHVSQVRNEKYGKPFSEEGGPEGRCIYVLCKKDENGKACLLTEEEEKIKKELLTKWLGDANEKTILVSKMVENGEIESEQAWSYYSDMMNLPKYYLSFMADFREKTGIQLVKGTYIEKELKFADDKEFSM